MAIIYVDGDSPIAEQFAKEAAEALFNAYPNHSWWVECRGGILIIKHFMLSGLRGVIGMVRHMSALDGDAGKRKKDIINSAGELLERARLRRGAYNGEIPKTMELENKQQRKHFHDFNPMDVIH